MHPSSRARRPTVLRDLAWLQEAREDDGQYEDDGEEEDREYRAGLPVGKAGLEEVDDLVPIHVAARPPYERGGDELAERRDEDEQEGRDQAGRSQRQGDASERVQSARPQVARCLE